MSLKLVLRNSIGFVPSVTRFVSSNRKICNKEWSSPKTRNVYMREGLGVREVDMTHGNGAEIASKVCPCHLAVSRQVFVRAVYLPISSSGVTARNKADARIRILINARVLL